MKKNITIILVVAMLVMSTASAFATASFTDVKNTNWAYSYINQLVEKGGIKGYPDGTFKPQSTMTAAEFVKTIVAIVAGEQEKVDGDSHWASGYMSIAEKGLQIVPEGMFDKSDWDKPISRQKMGVIMEKTAQVVYEEKTITDETKLGSIQAGIKDYDSICKYCKDYIVQAVGRGLITGYSDGTFKPEQTATRAEATTMIVRLIDNSFRVTESTKSEGTVIDIKNYAPNSTFAADLQRFNDKAVYIENGSKFNLSYGTKYSDSLYTLKYNDIGILYGITSSGNAESLAQHVPVNAYEEVLCEGNIKDYKYLAMWCEDYLYVFPNPFL